jgi:NAD(P)-dependent dehydrogenase (short-subunit alcohol dehydrogenase family)
MPVDEVDDFGGLADPAQRRLPAELAPAFVFLASAESSYITGERIGVHGGMPLP